MMIFMTEEELRRLYRKEPFKEYILDDNTRLTPGGRQFLVDRKIKIVDSKEQDFKKVKTSNLEIQKKDEEALLNLQLDHQLLQAIFLEKARTIYDYDQLLANQVFEWVSVLKAVEEKKVLTELPWSSNTNLGLGQNIFSHQVDFRMNKDLALAPNGREATSLNVLYHMLRRFCHQYEHVLDEEQSIVLMKMLHHISRTMMSILGGSIC